MKSASPQRSPESNVPPDQVESFQVSSLIRQICKCTCPSRDAEKKSFMKLLAVTTLSEYRRGETDHASVASKTEVCIVCSSSNPSRTLMLDRTGKGSGTSAADWQYTMYYVNAYSLLLGNRQAWEYPKMILLDALLALTQEVFLLILPVVYFRSLAALAVDFFRRVGQEHWPHIC